MTIFFGSPDKKEFQNIVKTLADRYGIEIPEEELYLEANRWELSHGGLSGRTAQQFIDSSARKKIKIYCDKKEFNNRRLTEKTFL